jgi:hypothetical protein
MGPLRNYKIGFGGLRFGTASFLLGSFLLQDWILVSILPKIIVAFISKFGIYVTESLKYSPASAELAVMFRLPGLNLFTFF